MDQEFDDLDGLDGDDPAGSGSGGEGSAPQGEAGADGTSEARINDLMSKWQTEEARANRLQAALDAAKPKDAGAKDDGGQVDPKQAELDEYVSLARESYRQSLYEREPRLREYGLEPTAISGANAAEMQKSFEAHRKLLDTVESKARNAVLREHGLSPELGGGAASQPVDYSSMSKDDFEKAVARVRGY